ncbi:uncharacterized protein Z518_02497 [Rhinocladiella mackenziei CBS 650.93]|uniref:Uncharacterized protein n=1 Tax=Rhinocladiella mackenziei CBS 650.93 TaxID=1442369 RepID=A0A0D2HBN1_9EURO|nr:uncharacterized protein Z518_02497 [Rhinocladiella mackenziei CBS 650.93]KIX07843.1 hypothetical protein Z518_02497 [Rhinocladiella mackenziei CBS 650.93]
MKNFNFFEGWLSWLETGNMGVDAESLANPSGWFFAEQIESPKYKRAIMDAVQRLNLDYRSLSSLIKPLVAAAYACERVTGFLFDTLAYLRVNSDADTDQYFANGGEWEQALPEEARYKNLTVDLLQEITDSVQSDQETGVLLDPRTRGDLERISEDNNVDISVDEWSLNSTADVTIAKFPVLHHDALGLLETIDQRQ